MQAWSPELDDFESIDPATEGAFEVTFADGTKHTAIPVWQKFAERCAEYAPEKSESITGVPAEKVTEAALVYGTRVDPRWGNGGIMYQLAVEHHGNAIMNCRAIELLTAITGNTDGPGGQRGSTKIDVTYMGSFDSLPQSPLLDNPKFHPEIMEKQLGRDTHPLFAWWTNWANANTVWEAGVTGEPYPVKGCVCQSGDFLNMGNTTMAWDTLAQLDFMFDIDLWHHPTAEMADVLAAPEPGVGWRAGTVRTLRGASSRYALRSADRRGSVRARGATLGLGRRQPLSHDGGDSRPHCAQSGSVVEGIG